jgi:L-seryl-tRNA(Ser) seleniumtransferase
MKTSLRPVINASGVVLHTNLGRAPLSDAAIKAVTNVARGYCNLEMDLDSGERGERYSHVEKLLCELTGAEAALVVNNNAGAVLLALHALAREKEVVVARGELVEIGGSFRIPEVMAQSGAVLREVGTTNRTYPRDYERAVGTDTALFLKVHPSNFRVVGFTREVMRRELVEVGRRHQIPVMEDLGSGVFVDLQQYGIDPEPTVQETLAAGIDIVTVSGDKLLGGPQAGIILGRAEMVQLLKEDPLLRALRIDKMTLAALEATLRAYLQEDVQKKVPVLRMLSITAAELEKKAVELKDLLTGTLKNCNILLKPGVSRAGGGSLPLAELPTTLVAIYPKEISPVNLAERLRQGDPPVVVRLQDEGVLIDPRTLLPGDEEVLAKALQLVVSK